MDTSAVCPQLSPDRLYILLTFTIRVWHCGTCADTACRWRRLSNALLCDACWILRQRESSGSIPVLRWWQTSWTSSLPRHIFVKFHPESPIQKSRHCRRRSRLRPRSWWPKSKLGAAQGCDCWDGAERFVDRTVGMLAVYHIFKHKLTRLCYSKACPKCCSEWPNLSLSNSIASPHSIVVPIQQMTSTSTNVGESPNFVASIPAFPGSQSYCTMVGHCATHHTLQ